MLNGHHIIDQALAALKHKKPGPAVLHGFQQLFQGQPALHAAVVGFHKAQPAFNKPLRHGLSGVLLGRPHIRRRYGVFNPLRIRRGIQSSPRRIGDNQLLFAEFAVDIIPARVITGDPEAGEHIKAIVKGPEFRPSRIDGEILDNMGSYGEFREISAAQSVPITIPVRRPDILREKIQGVDVVRRAFQQVNIVLYGGLEECVILRVFVFHEIPRDEQPLDPLVANAARVCRHVNSLRKRCRATAAGCQTSEFLLRELRGLFDENPVVFLALVFAGRGGSIAFHVSELDVGAIDKAE